VTVPRSAVPASAPRSAIFGGISSSRASSAPGGASARSSVATRALASPSSTRRTRPSGRRSTASSDSRLGPTRTTSPPSGTGGACRATGTARRDRRRRLGPAPGPPLAPPEAQAVDDLRLHAEHRDPADALGASDAAADANDRVRIPAGPGEAAVTLERRRVQHGDELREILAHEHVERHAVGGLLALGAVERGPVSLREERQREGEREERERRHHRARAAAEPCGGEPRGDAAAPRDQPCEEGQQARAGDRGPEREQAGDEQEDEAGGLALGQASLVGGPAEQRRGGGEHRRHGQDVGRPEPARAISDRDRGDHEPRGHADRDQGEGEPSRRDDALPEHAAHGLAGEAGEDGPRQRAARPAQGYAGDGDRQ
jgi:hypothetical protein